MKLEPYLFFNGRCQEAIDFYRKAVGAEVTMLMHYKDSPEPEMILPGSENKVMHASLRIGDNVVMLSDGDCGDGPEFRGMSLSLSLEDPAEAERLFSGLAQGGQVTMPLGKTFWSPCFGMLTDRFGVGWMINVMEDVG